jgi:gliding motility-associated lipoprotein GldH
MKTAPAKTKNKIVILIFISLLVASCSGNDVFFSYKTINTSGWNKDSLIIFDIPVKDTSAVYNIYVNIRNRGEYPYQNLWMFLSRMSPDSLLTNDSIECYLADQRGKWLGSGIGSIMEMPVLYQQKIRFKKVGVYHYKIAHGMRDSILSGINDIGMRVEKVVSRYQNK